MHTIAIKVRHFGGAKATGIKQFHHRTVAQKIRILFAGCAEEREHLFVAEYTGQVLPCRRLTQQFRRIRRQERVGMCKATEDANGGDVASDGTDGQAALMKCFEMLSQDWKGQRTPAGGTARGKPVRQFAQVGGISLKGERGEATLDFAVSEKLTHRLLVALAEQRTIGRVG